MVYLIGTGEMWLLSETFKHVLVLDIFSIAFEIALS